MRLIDADALKTNLDTLEASGGHEYYRRGMNDTLHKFMPKILDDQPTIDPDELRPKGEWEPQYEFDFDACTEIKTGYTCDQCWAWHLQPSNYCPNCGAYMRGDDNAR